MMVLQNRLEDGHREFAQLREDLQGRDSEESKYLLHFAQYWLAQLRNDFGQSEFELKATSNNRDSDVKLAFCGQGGQEYR